MLKSSELSSTVVPIKSNDKHFRDRVRASSCSLLLAASSEIVAAYYEQEITEISKLKITALNIISMPVSDGVLPSFFTWDIDVRDIWNT